MGASCVAYRTPTLPRGRLLKEQLKSANVLIRQKLLVFEKSVLGGE
jgi:hypothetical protein